ncbi:MAG: shikimate dehydrogenase [Chloroflexi bacterium]|nr:MAG: shikimate dehydrogenase [Chloroflexota bacterium]
MAEVNYRHELVGAFGDPIDENPTGIMMEAAFEALNLPWRYQLLHVVEEALPDAVRGVRALGFQGFNCTIPHKVAVMRHLDDIAPDARLIGAVNTVRREGNAFIGENTDGKGFLRGIREDAGLDPAGKRIVVLGAGGASRAVTVELALAGAAELIVVNRTVQRGQQLAQHLNDKTDTTARFRPWSETLVIPNDVDVLVNATSIGLYPDVDAMPDVDLSHARDDMLVCDAIPNPPETPLIKTAAARGLPTLNGLSMLVYQGVTAFKMWTGQDPPEDVMKSALQQAFGL